MDSSHAGRAEGIPGDKNLHECPELTPDENVLDHRLHVWKFVHTPGDEARLL